MTARSPLISPFEYFKRARHDPLLAGLVVFVVYVIAQIALVVSLFNVLVDQVANAPAEFDRAVDQFMVEMFLPMIVLLFVVSAIGLLVVATLMHYLSKGNNTTGTVGDAIAVASWAYAPNLLFHLPLKYIHARHEIEQQTFDGSDPQILQREFEAAQADGGGAIPLLLLVITIAWSVYILVYGTAATHEMDASDALLPAAIVGIGAFILGVL